MISTIVHAAALLCLLASNAEAWSSSSLITPLRHHRLTFSSSPLTKDTTCNNNIHRLAAAPAVRHTNNSVTPLRQHYRSGKHIILSATAAASASTDCNNNNNETHAVHKSNTRRIGIIYQLLQQLIIRSKNLKSSLNASLKSSLEASLTKASLEASLTKVNLKTVVSNAMLSFGIILSILGVNVSFPTMALARSTSVATSSRGASTTRSGASSGNGGLGVGSGAGGRKVTKFVVTLGAIGAGAASANLMRGKFNYCNDEDCEDDDGKKKKGGQQQHQQVGGSGGSDGGGDGGAVNNMKSVTTNNVNGGVNGNKATTKKEEESVVEPLSEKWIQQQLNDVEKRSIVLNDAIKMQQQQQQQKQQQVGNNKNTQKKVSIGNTIGINNNNKNPLVKNLDSKIELLQRQQNERTIEQQRRITKESNEMNQKVLLAKEMAEKKIEAAELEYKQQQQQVAVPKEQMTQQQQTTRLSKVLVGYGGSPAKSKEEDLELTTQIILEHVNTIDNDGGGVVDDD